MPKNYNFRDHLNEFAELPKIGSQYLESGKQSPFADFVIYITKSMPNKEERDSMTRNELSELCISFVNIQISERQDQIAIIESMGNYVNKTVPSDDYEIDLENMAQEFNRKMPNGKDSPFEEFSLYIKNCKNNSNIMDELGQKCLSNFYLEFVKGKYQEFDDKRQILYKMTKFFYEGLNTPSPYNIVAPYTDQSTRATAVLNSPL